jgi:hypothetical protein
MHKFGWLLGCLVSEIQTREQLSVNMEVDEPSVPYEHFAS